MAGRGFTADLDYVRRMSAARAFGVKGMDPLLIAETSILDKTALVKSVR